jgi:hypothetical protein
MPAIVDATVGRNVIATARLSKWFRICPKKLDLDDCTKRVANDLLRNLLVNSRVGAPTNYLGILWVPMQLNPSSDQIRWHPN